MDDAAAVRGLVLGGDLGGTSTRIVVVDPAGAVLGRGVAGGGNPVSNPDTSAAAFADALGRALREIDPRQVRSAVIGVAGGGRLRDPRVRAAFDESWWRCGLTCTPDYRSDLEVAYAAGTTEPSGSVLIAGTGAVAGVITDHRLGATADGDGWLLGDDGSGFWMGREAVRATLRFLESGTGGRGVLVRSVLSHLVPTTGGGESERNLVIRAVHDRAPVRLADLAPLVTTAYDAGDPAAVRIVEGAARLLADTLARLPGGHAPGPLVLAGSLTRGQSPVGARLRDVLAAQAGRAPATASDEVWGAAWLALLAAGPGTVDTGIWSRLRHVTISDRSDS